MDADCCVSVCVHRAVGDVQPAAHLRNTSKHMHARMHERTHRQTDGRTDGQLDIKEEEEEDS